MNRVADRLEASLRPLLSSRRTCLWGVLAGSLLTVTVLAESSPTTLRPRGNWSNCFGHERISLRYQIDGEVSPNTRLVWSCSAEHRTLMRGEHELPARQGNGREIHIDLAIPPVRDGVVIALQFRVQAVEPNGQIAAEHERTLRVFPRDPFAARRQWIEDRKITLYDPAGDTAKVLDAMQVPYSSARSLTHVAETREGVVVVGAGYSWQAPANLAAVLNDLARRGRKVICLAADAGQLAFPGRADGIDPPAQIALRREDVICELDKRLDADAWPEDGRVIRSAMTVASKGGQVMLSVEDSPEAWPWIEIAYESGGRLTICGFALIQKWNSSPTPRYLLAKMLE